MTVQEQTTPSPAEHDATDTEVLAVAPPSPVFVDSSGRRRRLLRRVAYGFIAVCMLYGGLICVSMAGGPVSSSAILPLPELDGSGGNAPDTPPSPAPAPTASSPTPRALVEALPRQRSASAKSAGTTPQVPATPKPVATPAPKPSPSPSPRASTTRPVEATTTPAPSLPAATGTSAPPGPTDSPSPTSPVAPAPPDAGAGPMGGSGGSAGSAMPVETGGAPTATPSSVEASL